MSDLLSAASLLLAVVSVLYGLWYPEISSALLTVVPPHAADRARPRRIVRDAAWGRALPVVTGSLCVGFVFLPKVVGIWSESLRDFSRNGIGYFDSYDPIRTAFCLVVLFSLSLGLHSMVRFIRLLRLLHRLSAKS